MQMLKVAYHDAYRDLMQTLLCFAPSLLPPKPHVQEDTSSAIQATFNPPRWQHLPHDRLLTACS